MNKVETHYIVAVYWKNGGYGGASEWGTETEARSHAERLLTLGYGKKCSPIHIRRVEEELVAVVTQEAQQ